MDEPEVKLAAGERTLELREELNLRLRRHFKSSPTAADPQPEAAR